MDGLYEIQYLQVPAEFRVSVIRTDTRHVLKSGFDFQSDFLGHRRIM